MINSKSFKYAVIIFSTLLYLYLILPFLNNVVFDSIIHFAYAETFVNGFPFQYNLHENVTASTSPFWTILLITLIWITGYKFIILLKIIIILTFVFTSYLIYLISRDIWNLKGFTLYSVLIVWLITVSVLKNSLGGMENILSTFQFTLIYYILCRNKTEHQGLSKLLIVGYGLFAGWAILTRPETGMICLGFITIYILRFSFKNKLTFLNSFSNLLILLCTACIILIPWYIYQFKMTGSIIPDSAISRTYLGKWYSIIIIRGHLYLQPETLFILLTAFLPFTAGMIYEVSKIIKEFKNFHQGITFSLYDNFHKTTAILIILIGIIFYSVIVGGVQIGRYLLPYYPFIFLVGIAGIANLYFKIITRNRWIAISIVIISCMMIIGANVYDYYLRVFGGKDIECNIGEIINSPENRGSYTTYFLKEFNYKANDTIKVAITEVQFRYFVDYRIKMLSLDGRTSLKIYKYADEDGFPDFEKFFMNEKPDIVEVKGWYNTLHGFRFPLNLFTYGLKESILADWDYKISRMNLGEKFYWKGNEMLYIVPGYVKIIWHNQNN